MNRMTSFMEWLETTVHSEYSEYVKLNIDVFETCLEKMVEAEQELNSVVLNKC